MRNPEKWGFKSCENAYGVVLIGFFRLLTQILMGQSFSSPLVFGGNTQVEKYFQRNLLASKVPFMAGGFTYSQGRNIC